MSTIPPAKIFPAIPAPPATCSAPVVVDVAGLVFPASMSPKIPNESVGLEPVSMNSAPVGPLRTRLPVSRSAEIVAPPMSMVLPARNISFQRCVGLPRLYVILAEGKRLPVIRPPINKLPATDTNDPAGVSNKRLPVVEETLLLSISTLSTINTPCIFAVTPSNVKFSLLINCPLVLAKTTRLAVSEDRYKLDPSILALDIKLPPVMLPVAETVVPNDPNPAVIKLPPVTLPVAVTCPAVLMLPTVALPVTPSVPVKLGLWLTAKVTVSEVALAVIMRLSAGVNVTVSPTMSANTAVPLA